MSKNNIWNKQWKEMQKNVFKYTALDGFGERAYACFNRWISKSDKNILEVGCGTGRFCIKIAKERPNSMIVGMDISSNAIKLASGGAKIRKIINVNFIQGDIFNIPFQDNYFDIVFSEGAIEYFHNFDDAVKEMKRVVKRGGKIIILVPNWYNFPFAIYKKIMGRNYEYGYEKLFKHGELISLFKRFHLRNVEISGFDPAHSIRRLSKHLFIFNYVGWLIDRMFIIPIDKITDNFMSKKFGFEIVIKGIKTDD